MVREAAWSDTNRVFIAYALTTGTLADIEWQVANGAKLFDLVAVDGEAEVVVAAFVLRVDREACRNVGVVVAAGGRMDGVNLTATILPHIETMFFGCDAVRVHTERRGLVRKLQAMGYGPTEYVLERTL